VHPRNGSCLIILAMNPTSSQESSSLLAKFSRAFTRIELIVTLAMAFLLAMIYSHGTVLTQNQSDSAICTSNLRRLNLAWSLYAYDNRGKLVGNLDGGGVQSLANSNLTWVLGWFDFGGGSPNAANTNTALLTDFSPLAKYSGRTASIFKCPADASLSLGTRGGPRVRSYSMNGYVGQRQAPYSAGYRQFRTIDEINQPSPSQLFVFIDEREDSINDADFQINMDGFDPRDPSRHSVVDYPAARHQNGPNLSFADGHVELWSWKDARTTPVLRPGQPLALGNGSPNNADVTRIQAATSSRVDK